MKITWIGQSGYLLQEGETKILIDPYLSDVVNRVANRPRMIAPPFLPKDFRGDAVVCTHDHLDHLDPDSIAEFDKDMLFVTPPSCEKHLIELGCNKRSIVDVGDVIKINNFTITAVPAFHTIEAIGLVVDWNGYRLYFTSDTLYDKHLEDMKEYKPDIMFICINGKLGNMDVDEAVRVTKAINPKAAVPTHYGMFESNTDDPKKFTSQLPNSFEMEFNTSYEIDTILKAVGR